LPRFLHKELPEARIVVATERDELSELLAEAVGDARILGIGGGDGSVRLAAGLAADKGLQLLVVPAETFNHFARTWTCGRPGRRGCAPGRGQRAGGRGRG
jgi:diacylglycerol kinase family enzyme